jgi:1-acyl-sn-glycerol-3-phosphate acyltransferase
MSLASRLARSSRDEMVSAVGLGRAPRSLQAAAGLLFERASQPLGRVLERFDRRIVDVGLSRAAAETLAVLGASVSSTGKVPMQGALLVCANHPGAYDALALLACMRRDDVAIIAHDRSFLRLLPSLAPHLVFVPEHTGHGRTTGLLRALRQLRKGGALLHFPAGAIEPDPAFPCDRELLGHWQSGTGMLVRSLARSNGVVVNAIVTGVHSTRAKSLLVTRVAERFGITTLAPLLQVAVPAFHDVNASITFADASLPSADRDESDDELTSRLRCEALALADRARARAPFGTRLRQAANSA